MRPIRLTTKLTAGALGLAALGAAMLASPAPARAEDDNTPIDTKIFRGILEGIGLRRDGEAILTYPERAPLVIPSGRALPPPEKSDAVAAKNPAWPVDPDVKRAKEEAAREKRTFTSADAELRHNENPLRPDELAPGPKPRVTRRSDDGYQTSPNGYGSQLSPSELGTKKSIFGSMFSKSDDTEVGKFTGEPPRASLTAPPPGYQTPSPDQPYGLGAPEKAKATDYKETHGLPDGAR
jgi:hypothetical protein